VRHAPHSEACHHRAVRASQSRRVWVIGQVEAVAFWQLRWSVCHLKQHTTLPEALRIKHILIRVLGSGVARSTHDPYRLWQPILKLTPHTGPFRGSAIVPTISFVLSRAPKRCLPPYIRTRRQPYSPECVELDFSHLGGKGIDMLLTQLHLKCSCRCLPSADHSDGALSSFEATSLITRLRTRPPWYLGTFCGLVSHHDTQKVPRDFV
jgi:hypothetical protein